MKKRIKILILLLLVFVFVIVVLLGTIIGSIFHELGHAMMAICFGLPINEIHIGISSHVQIETIGATNFQLSIVSLGSFILPEIIYLILLTRKSPYITIFRIQTGASLYSNIIGSIWVAIFGDQTPEMWDILLFQQYSNMNSKIIIGSLIVLLITNIILEIVSGRIRTFLLYIDEKLNSY